MRRHEQTDQASAKVLSGAGDVGRDADTLRGEVTQFLEAMSNANEDDRRQFERIPGDGAVAVATLPGGDNKAGRSGTAPHWR